MLPVKIHFIYIWIFKKNTKYCKIKCIKDIKRYIHASYIKQNIRKLKFTFKNASIFFITNTYFQYRGNG